MRDYYTVAWVLISALNQSW